MKWIFGGGVIPVGYSNEIPETPPGKPIGVVIKFFDDNTLWYREKEMNADLFKEDIKRKAYMLGYDFVADRTHDGRSIKMLTVIDEYSREGMLVKIFWISKYDCIKDETPYPHPEILTEIQAGQLGGK